MLKINRDLNFDPYICSILYTYTSMDEYLTIISNVNEKDDYFDLRHDLDSSDLDDTIFIIMDY